jgi:hypothetical protein
MKKIGSETKNLEEIKDRALFLMKSAGYEITTPVDVVLDEDLPFMGYTTESEDGTPVVVVSGETLKGGMSINLLIHELSHAYRIQSGHPSHDNTLLTTITGWAIHGTVVHPYQEKIIQTILNHLMDLYADDISFKIFNSNSAHSNLNEFFLNWVHDLSIAKDPLERAWENAESVVSAAFAQSNLLRHHVSDKDHKVEHAVNTFLSNFDKQVEGKYEFFKIFMVHMPEEIEAKDFEKLLIKYLGEFLKLTKLV